MVIRGPLRFTPGYPLAAPLGLGIWRGVLRFVAAVEKAYLHQAFHSRIGIHE